MKIKLHAILFVFFCLTLVKIVNAQPGNALNFDGTNDNVSLGTTLGNFGTGSFTVEAWFRTSAGGIKTIIGKRNAIQYGNYFRIAVTTVASFEIDESNVSNYTAITGSTIVNDGKWHHVAAVRTPTQILLYVDGKQDANPVTINANPNISNAVQLTLGQIFNGSSVPMEIFNGSLDEVRIWNTARTASDVQNNFLSIISNSATGLLAYFNFDHGTAGGNNAGITTLSDQTSNANNGTLNNFALTGSSSNWVESYAMVVPTATAASSITGTSFTANWTAPAIGTVTNYLLDVSTSSTFASFVSGYNGLTVAGTSQAVTGLSSNTTYYYRVRADKTSVTGQGGNSKTISTGPSAAVISVTPVTLINEGFNVVSPLPAGWAQQNLSTPTGTIPLWFQGNNATFSAQSGAANAYIAASFNSVAGANTISNWLFTPNITLTNGDVFTFWSRTINIPQYPDRLEVRMSTNGASVNAGATNASVGDFTNLLLTINPSLTVSGYPNVWTQYSVTISGLGAPTSGRLAFRYFVTNGGPTGANSEYIGIDNVVYTTAGGSTICAGGTANIKVDITGGLSPYTVVYNANPPGGPGGNVTVSGYVSGTNIPVTPSATTNYTLVSVTDASPAAGTGNSGTATISVANTWLGGTSVWNTPGNWCGGVPSASTDVIIPSGTPNMPDITSGTFAVKNITIAAGASLTVGGTLQIGGSITNAGTFTASTGTIELNGSTLQTIPSGAFASNTINNLIINNAAGVTLAGTLNLTGTLTPTAGTLTTGGHLVLKSSASNTARVAEGTGSYISGDVTVERYIPAKRAWRLLTSPLRGSNTSVYSAWQNAGIANGNNGVELWHPSGGTGLVTGGISSNLRSYNTTNNTWTAVTNTQSTNLFTSAVSAANNAFLIFPTAPYGGGNITSGATATTLAATGTLQTGTQTFNIPDAAFSNSEKIQLIGNPYASPVDFNLLTRTNVVKKFWVWDPQLAGLGGYVLLSDIDDDGNYSVTPSSTQTQHIQSGQAFFVEVNNTGASLVFNEDDKSTSNINTVFRTGTGTERLSIDMINPTDGLVIDGILAEYNNNFSNGIGAEDGQKLFRSNENFYLTRNAKPLMLEGRKLIDNNDTLFLTISGMQQQAYRFAINGSNFANDANLSAFLKDKFLSTETAISLSGATAYNFTVTADNNSKAADRFMVVFRSNASLPVTLTNVKAYQQNSGITVEWNTQSESGMQQYEVEKSANGTNFVKVNTTAAKSGTTNSYNFFDATPFSGANYYRIKAISLNGDVKYSSIVVVRLNTKGTKVTLYPNPVKGSTIQLQLSNLEKGNYSVNLFNQLGQPVLNRTINHNGGSSNQTIEIGTIASGVYELRLSNGQTVITQKLIKE